MQLRDVKNIDFNLDWVFILNSFLISEQNRDYYIASFLGGGGGGGGHRNYKIIKS